MASGVVTIPIVTLPATTDSYPPNLTFTAVLYDENGARQNTKLSNFILDPDLLTANADTVIESTVTITAAGTVASQGSYTYRGQSTLKGYWTLEGQTSSTTNYAIVWTGTQWNITSSSGAIYYYSTEDAANPWDVVTWVADAGIAPLPAVTEAASILATTWQAVFFTNNTPCIPCGTDRDWLLAWLISYINNISIPWASTIVSGVGGKVYISKTPDLSYEPEAVGTNEWAWLGVDDSRYLHEWDGDLAAAITDIGSDEVTLWITEADQYTNTGSLITSGTLTVGKAYEFAEYTGAVVYLNNVNNGTGYSVAAGVATTGGSGTLTVDITAVDGGGEITGVEINNAGSGYAVGEVLAISGGGGNARLVVAEVYNGNFTNVGATFLGYPTNFANQKGTVFIATGTTPTSWGLTSLRPCLVVPNNIHLAFSGSGTIRAGNGGGIYIESLLDPGQRQIFTSTGFGKIFVAPGACTNHNLAWWTGLEPSADNTHEFKQLQQSLSVGQKGGTAVIPIGDWLTEQITWTNQVKVMGSAQADIDGGQRGTAIYPADETALYTGVFSIQQIFHSITFEDMLLSANTSETVNAFRFIATQSTSENLTFNRVRFATVAASGAVSNTVFRAENSFEEFVNINFYNCTWTCWDDTACVEWETTNSVALFSNCQFRARVGSTAFYSEWCGYITFLQPDFRGTSNSSDLPITPDRTILAAFDTVSGDNTVNLNEDYFTAGAQFTREDLGGFLSVAGVTWGAGAAAKTYITQLNTAFQVEVADAPNSTVNNQNVTVSYPGDYPYAAYAALDVRTHLEINLIGSSDEGLNYLIVDRAADILDTINIIGSKVQGRILFANGSSSMNCIGSEFYSGCFNADGHSPYVRMIGGQISQEIVPRDDEEYPFPNFRELLSASAWHLCDNEIDFITDTSLKMGDRIQTTLNQSTTPVQIIRRDQFGASTGDTPQLSILNSFLPGNPDQVGLQLGTSWRGSDQPLHYYDFYRQITAGTTTGALVIRGSQTAFAGIYHNGYILADGSIKSTDPVEAVGYATGAGNTVTQGAGSGKATAVTINAVSGQITMNNANLNAGATVFFVVNNTSVRAYDTPIIGHASGGTPDSYEITWNTVSNLTSFRVGVKNITGGNLAEAIVLNFNLFRGVNA